MVKSNLRNINALKRVRDSEKLKPYITYQKDGRVVRHKSLFIAKAIAKSQSLSGRRGFVDKNVGNSTRSIFAFEPKLKFIRKPSKR